MKKILILPKVLSIAAFALLFNLTVGLPIVAGIVGLIILGLFVNIPAGSLGAVVSNNLIGRSKQSAGNMTFSTWKGINVLKNKATSVANPKTGAQLMRRSAFSQAVALFRANPAAIRAGYKKQAIKQSEFNAFTGEILKNAFDYSAPPVALLIPANILTSKGTIATTPTTTVSGSSSAHTVTSNFATTATQPGQSVTDLALLSAYNVTKQEWSGAVTTAARSTGTGTFTIPTIWASGDSVDVYTAFYNSITGNSSDSVQSTISLT